MKGKVRRGDKKRGEDQRDEGREGKHGGEGGGCLLGVSRRVKEEEGRVGRGEVIKKGEKLEKEHLVIIVVGE